MGSLWHRSKADIAGSAMVLFLISSGACMAVNLQIAFRAVVPHEGFRLGL
jgi:hypothetical protein